MTLIRTLAFFLLGVLPALSAIIPASASTAKVSLGCELPNNGVVACRLAGTGFHAREHVRVTYRVQFTALPPVHGKIQTTVYRRDATSNAQGAFLRPLLRFAVIKYHESYKVTVSAVGDRGDRAQLTYVAIAQ
jgi:hypothetical protein